MARLAISIWVGTLHLASVRDVEQLCDRINNGRLGSDELQRLQNPRAFRDIAHDESGLSMRVLLPWIPPGPLNNVALSIAAQIWILGGWIR